MIPSPNKSPRLGHYASIERVDDEGIIERRCKVCGDFQVLDLFCRAANCHRGRTSECKACRQKRRRGTRNYRREDAYRSAQTPKEPQ